MMKINVLKTFRMLLLVLGPLGFLVFLAQCILLLSCSVARANAAGEREGVESLKCPILQTEIAKIVWKG